MWQIGNQPIVIKKEPHVNDVLAKIDGFVDEEYARELLYKFLKTNIGFTTKLISGVDLFPFQEIAIKTMMKRDYVLGIWSRGASKSFSTAIFIFLHAIFNPNSKIAIISKTFRQSRAIFKTIEDIAAKPQGQMLMACITDGPSHSTDEWSMSLGSSEVKALPLGTGEKLRGFRFNVLVIDELLLMPEKVINEVIMPFLSTNKDPKKVHDIRKIEDQLIREKIITEEDRIRFPKNKMIGLSSASYTFEPLYKTYKTYIEKIISGTDDGHPLKPDKSNAIKGSYAVLQIGYDYIQQRASGMYDEALINKARSEMSAAQFKREFGAQFSDESAGFYNMKAMNNCTVEYGKMPCTEIRGDPNCKYILAVDPSWSENDSSDFFAMIVLKIDDEDESKYTIVHSYAVAGGKFNEHANYFMYLLCNFNVVFIMMDHSGGTTFLQFFNEFDKSKRYQLTALNVDFEDTENRESQLRTAKTIYNPKEGKIVYFQTFNPDWIRMANEELQAAIDHRRLSFAAPAEGIEAVFKSQRSMALPELKGLKFLSIIKKNNRSKNVTDSSEYDLDEDLGDDDSDIEAKKIDLIERQGFLINLIKTQCALIEVKLSDSGHITFTLPQNLKKQTGPNKTRRDLYTALLIGNWAVKCFNAFSNFVPEESFGDFIPTIVKN